MADFEGVSALSHRPDPETLELLLYGDRYVDVKSAKYQIDAMRDYLNNWIERLIDSINGLDFGTEVRCIQGPDGNFEDIEVPVSPMRVAYDMMTKRSYMVVRATLMEDDDIDDKTPPEKILAGILNQIHRNYKALARLDEIEQNVTMWGRISGAERYSKHMLRENSAMIDQYSIALKMSNLDPISYNTVKKSRDKTVSYEEMMRRQEEARKYGV